MAAAARGMARCATQINLSSIQVIDSIICKNLYDILYKGLIAGYLRRGMDEIHMTILFHRLCNFPAVHNSSFVPFPTASYNQ